MHFESRISEAGPQWCPAIGKPMIFLVPPPLPQISVTKFQNFKSKKRPWGMQASPVIPSPISSERPFGGQNPVLQEEAREEEASEDPRKTSQPEVSTFRYKSRANVLSRSFRGHDSAAARFAARYKSEQEVESEGSSTMAAESGGVSDDRGDEAGQGSGELVEQASGSMESSTCTSAEGSRTELNAGGGEEGGVLGVESAKPLTVKSHPYTRRIDITSPQNLQRTRPQILAYGKPDMEKQKSKTGPAMLTRRSTLGSVPTGRRLLPAPPIRRSSRPTSRLSATSLTGDDQPESNPPTPGSMQSIDEFATKLVSSLEGVAAKERSLCDGVIGENNSASNLLAKPRPRVACRSESLSSLHSRDEQPPSPRVKHTVQYKNSVLGKT